MKKFKVGDKVRRRAVGTVMDIDKRGNLMVQFPRGLYWITPKRVESVTPDETPSVGPASAIRNRWCNQVMAGRPKLADPTAYEYACDHVDSLSDQLDVAAEECHDKQDQIRELERIIKRASIKAEDKKVTLRSAGQVELYSEKGR